jgi:hypothetical protein
MSVSKNVTVPDGTSTGPGSSSPAGDVRGAPVPAEASAKVSLKAAAPDPRRDAGPGVQIRSA